MRKVSKNVHHILHIIRNTVKNNMQQCRQKQPFHFFTVFFIVISMFPIIIWKVCAKIFAD